MTKKNYELIASAIWRSGFIKDKNKVEQKARESMRRLIIYNLASSLANENPRFNKSRFYRACGIDDSELKGQYEPLVCVHEECKEYQIINSEYCKKHYPAIKK